MRLICRNCNTPIKANNKFFLSKMPVNNELFSKFVVKKNYIYNFLNCNFCNLIQLHSTNKNFLRRTSFPEALDKAQKMNQYIKKNLI